MSQADLTSLSSDKSLDFARESGLPLWRRRFMRDGLLYPIGFTLLVKRHEQGAKHIPATGPVIILMNHIAFIDPVVAGNALRRRWVTPMAKKEVFNYPLLNWLIRMWGVVPVDRFQLDRTALQKSLALLQQGHCILVAPEGTRNPTLQEFKEGFVYIATKSNAVIVPTAVEGTHQFGHNLKRLRRTPVQVIYGKPFRFKTNGRNRIPRAEMTQMAHEAAYQIAHLLDEPRRGFYHDLSQATTTTLDFLV